MSHPEPYYYVRWTWGKAHDITALTSKLRVLFGVIELRKLGQNGDLGTLFSKKEIAQIKVKADTLSAYVAPIKAVLFQKQRALFTDLDLELRKAILALYPHSTFSPIPLFYMREPKFETQGQR
jgi:hypothetical protein